jgi:outer membrane protein assembly factor BamB
MSGVNGNLQQRQTMPWGGVRFTQNGQNLLGDVALCGEHTLCFQHGRDVTAIDPLTGQVQWVRHGVEIGCDLLGDDEVVILAPPNDKPAQVLRTADGELLGERPMPPADKRWTNVGRCVLAFREHGGGDQVALALIDPWTQHDVWSETFSGWNNGPNPGVKGTLIDGDTVALMQSDGRFVVLNLADGHKLIDERLAEEQNQHNLLQSIHVFRSADQYLLMVNRPTVPTGLPSPRGLGDVRNLATNVQPVLSSMGETMSQIVSGHIYAFDRATGKPQWAMPAYVDQQGLLLGQPSELPVLTFIRNIQTIAMNRNRQMYGSVLCLDKRSGRLVYEDDDLPPITGFDISGNLDDKTVTLSLANQMNQLGTPVPPITLKFTDASVAPEPPYQAGAFEKNDSPTDSKE